MQHSLSLIAGNDSNFDIELALERQVGILPLPFPGMDSKYFLQVCFMLIFIFHRKSYAKFKGLFPIGFFYLQTRYAYMFSYNGNYVSGA